MKPISNAVRMTRNQQGSALIEILVSILIFAVGILGILGLQTTTVGVASDARFRTEAAALADEYVALMSIADPSTLGTYASGGSAFTAWSNLKVVPTNAALTSVALPNATFAVAFPAGVSATAGTAVNITITWRGASETNGGRHVTRTSIAGPRPTESL